MQMKEAVEKLVVHFGPPNMDLSKAVDRIMGIMPKKDVPDDALRKVMAIGKLLKPLCNGDTK